MFSKSRDGKHARGDNDLYSRRQHHCEGRKQPLPRSVISLYDGHGSTRLLTNAQGAITDRFDYTAFGNPIGFNPFTAATTYLYAGQQFDTGSGLYYLRARMYDPRTGRFTQTDPVSGQLGDAQSLHRYAYSWNDPVNLADPSGESPLDEISEALDQIQKSIAYLAFGSAVSGSRFLRSEGAGFLGQSVLFGGIVGPWSGATVITFADVIAVVAGSALPGRPGDLDWTSQPCRAGGRSWNCDFGRRCRNT